MRRGLIPQPEATQTRGRRTQAERTEETRTALIEAAIRVLHRSGFNAATTAVIADEAGISRGSIIYQFSTRAQLMADVISYVYDQEASEYARLASQGVDMSHAEDWPEVLWTMFSRPSGLAVNEILQASRSDPELAALVIPTQERVEAESIEGLRQLFPGDEDELRAHVRFFVWATRGLAMSSVLSRDTAVTEQAVQLFKRIVRTAFTSGSLHGDASG
jgi:AcrR family transcriptional regulator